MENLEDEIFDDVLAANCFSPNRAPAGVKLKFEQNLG
jgi:hypothetical protein